jgi:glycosyltransferase involved in cell wall biosynthesis
MERSEKVSTRSTSTLHTVSFVIPHKGRETMLIQTLASIAAQDQTGFAVDVIVVTKNITPLTIPDELQEKLTLSILQAPDTVTISAQRNRGVALSKATYLAFIDADIQLSNNWLQILFSALHKNNRVLVSAHQQAPINALVLEHIRTSLSNVELDTNVTFLPGRNLFLRRSHCDMVGGFPEHLATCEDYYFTQSLSEIGPCFYSSDTAYIHLGEDKILHEMYRKEIWRGQSNIASLKGRKLPLRELPSFIIPLYLVITFSIASVCLLSFAITTLTLPLIIGCSALIGFIIPFLAYCIRLIRLVPQCVSWWDVVKFYSVYFPARAIGTIRGSFYSISTDSHA